MTTTIFAAKVKAAIAVAPAAIAYRNPQIAVVAARRAAYIAAQPQRADGVNVDG